MFVVGLRFLTYQTCAVLKCLLKRSFILNDFLPSLIDSVTSHHLKIDRNNGMPYNASLSFHNLYVKSCSIIFPLHIFNKIIIIIIIIMTIISSVTTTVVGWLFVRRYVMHKIKDEERKRLLFCPELVIRWFFERVILLLSARCSPNLNAHTYSTQEEAKAEIRRKKNSDNYVDTYRLRPYYSNNYGWWFIGISSNNN